MSEYSEYRAGQESWDCQQAVNAAAQPAWQQARCAEEQAAEAAAREERETLELRTRLNCLERRYEVQLQQLSDLQDRHHRLAGSVRLLEREVVRDRPEPAPLATDQELYQLYDRTGPTIVDAFRALYNLGRQHGAQSAAPAAKGSSTPPPAGPPIEAHQAAHRWLRYRPEPRRRIDDPPSLPADLSPNGWCWVWNLAWQRWTLVPAQYIEPTTPWLPYWAIAEPETPGVCIELEPAP